ncbi:MAG: membrane protein insertase YidC, partial [Bacteroidota bacterium]
SYRSMAEMKVLKPALDTIKTKYGNDLQKIQIEQVKLYKEMGINPLSGCIPVLLQMPILLAMFNFFPNAIELRQKAFLWAHDLSTYDSIINLPISIPAYGSHVSLFTLLMTASTLLYTWSSNQVSAPQGPMKLLAYLMPITFMFILNTFPAGLSFYYFVSNLVTFGQQALVKRFVDEDKIKKKLAKNKARNGDGKKSMFQSRLQAALRAAQIPKKQ